jgi:predicted MFS family arabinose efflux permease
LGGYIAPPLLVDFSWHGIFVFGGLCSLLLLALVYFLLPESLDILAARRGPKALGALNKVLGRLQLPAMAELPAPAAKAARGSLLDLLRQPILVRTLLMGLTYLLFMMTEYFFLNWNNQLTTNAGFSDADGIFISRLTSLGGLAGGIVVGLLGVRLPIRLVAALALLVMGLSVVAFGAAGADLPLAKVTATLIGFGIFGAAVAVYATGANAFPARVRATGMGIVMSAGRVGSIFGPSIAGALLSAQFTRFTVCALLAVPVLLAIAAVVKVPVTPLEFQPQRQ